MGSLGSPMPPATACSIPLASLSPSTGLHLGQASRRIAWPRYRLRKGARNPLPTQSQGGAHAGIASETSGDDTACSSVSVLREGKTMAECSECGAVIETDLDFEEGEIIVCEECGAELEVISEDPLEFALAPEEEEDWGE